MQINHGIPPQSHFIIFQPANTATRAKLFNTKGLPDWENKTVELKSPINNKIENAFCVNWLTFDIDNEKLPDMFCLLAYGKTSEFVLKTLKTRYPQLNLPGAQLDLWVMKKTEEAAK